MIRIAIVGAGLIGRERLIAVRNLISDRKPLKLDGIFDANLDLAKKVAAEFDTFSFDSLEALLSSSPDWIFVALPHDAAVKATELALKCTSQVLMEKPMGRDLNEARRLLEVSGGRLYIGFNYRFYEGISKALQDVRSGRFGELIAVDFLLGHGCFPGQEKTWKLNDRIAGGGCLIDPGIHLLDLCGQVTPEKLRVQGGRSWRGFWNTGIEEDVSLLLSSGSMTMNLRISIVNWRSTFSMRINGTDGYGIVSGRNRSYGNQTYTFGPRWGWQASPSQAASEIVEIETDGNNAFTRETQAILFPNENPNGTWPHAASATDGYRCMELLDEIRASLNLRRNYSE